MKNIYQIQLGFIITAIALFIISYIPYNSSVRALENQQEIVVKISEVSCRSAKSVSGFYFFYNNKNYHVKILGKTCYKIHNGDNYKLLYDKKNDQFRDIEHALMIKNRLKYYIIFFLLTIIPYTFIYKILYK
ncbi:hypothetical protein SAMN05421738_1273 [Algoriella xinjiangensis]|uniref:DUF3592 domain-containing protein n=1 Tax=Algoriella xinjiangensis TaxID=684065 RepID=A0A1I5BCE2_9FLAO|nr:hypothetical protein [Algoriella xinjiangensis]SFN72199.1 hypothetical protein SAMN05421738_1273 [Algoriella xinjiangensis]VDH16933.1 Uncharacterised protein [Algoriella xinjiangensis]